MCECEVCTRLKHYNEIGVPEEVVDYILELEMDRDYMKAIFDGSWPSGKQLLERALEKYNGQR